MGITQMISIKPILSQFFYYSGLATISRHFMGKKGKYILMFHGISEKKNKFLPLEIQPHLDRVEFESILVWVKKRFPILSPEELFDLEKNGILFTFDDGFHNNGTNVVPFLEKYEIPGLFFISTQHVKNPSHWLEFIQNKLEDSNLHLDSIPESLQEDYFNGISEDQLKKMSQNPFVTIGSHTISHPNLTECHDQLLFDETQDSKSYLEALTGNSVNYFAYPYGNYNQSVIEAVKGAGYKAAFGIDKVNHLGESRFEIPRIGLYDSGKPYLASKMSGLYLRPLTF